jgi:hypothetical protein
MKKNLKLYCFFIAILLTQTSISQIVKNNKSKHSKSKFGTLFKTQDTLHFNLIANMKPLLRDRGLKPIYHNGNINYTTAKAKKINLALKIRVRGNFRKSTENCQFPPLLLNFDRKNKGNSVFNRQNQLKLVTHCISRDNIVKEQLVYRIYNLITDNSFKTRLAKVTYIDSAQKRKPEKKLAFLLEDELILAKRIKAKTYTKVRLRHSQLDTLAMATISVFEYMIGNTDWSVPYLHNIKAFRRSNILPLPIPYDFDHSGLVNANYANPAPELNLTSVKERLYRGINYPKPIFDSVFAKLQMLKPQIISLYEGNPGLDKSYIKYAVDYLNEFYEIIENDKKVKNYIVEQGIKNDLGGVVIKGLNK